ncbi:MAG: hypothetical protein AAF391_03120, partial [Bacteroidota bacterium]
MKHLINLFFITTVFSCLGQELQVDNDSISLKNAIDQFNNSTSETIIFYRSEWLEHLKIHNDNVKSDLGVEEYLDFLLQDTPLTYYANGNHIILLYNT